MSVVVAPALFFPSESLAYKPKFPPVDLLNAVRDFIPALPPWDGHEGPRARVSYSPGAIAVSRSDLARRERTLNRAAALNEITVDTLAGELVDYCPTHGAPVVIEHRGERHPWCPTCGADLIPGHFRERPPSRAEVLRWSRKSRANMTRALCEIDYGPMLYRGHPPAMITLTYPGDWLTVAPNGAAAKRHFWAFRRAYARAWGRPLLAVWKLETQRRGAPHFHMLMTPPRGAAAAGRYAGLNFRRWLSETWARIVGHPDPEQRLRHRGAGTRIDFADGLRARDPKRVAIYFTKHGSFRAKEYQNQTPTEWQAPGQGPGRFWGYWHLRREVRAVELSPEDAILAARTIRRWARAQGTTHQVEAWRTPGGRLRPASWDVIGLAGAQELAAQSDLPGRYRRVRRRVRRMRGRGGAGWVSVNDGSAFMSQLARYLTSRHRPPPS